MPGITYQEALASAAEFIKNVYEEDGVQNFRVEEIDSTASLWRITLSFVRKEPSSLPFDLLGGQKYERAYKIIEVGRSDGKVQSMKIRSIK